MSTLHTKALWKYHQPHHLYRDPTAFAAQAIDVGEAMMFGQCAVLGTLLYPISIFTQYSFGMALQVYSILAHDSSGALDKGFHMEHHVSAGCQLSPLFRLYSITNQCL